MSKNHNEVNQAPDQNETIKSKKYLEVFVSGLGICFFSGILRLLINSLGMEPSKNGGNIVIIDEIVKFMPLMLYITGIIGLLFVFVGAVGFRYYKNRELNTGSASSQKP